MTIAIRSHTSAALAAGTSFLVPMPASGVGGNPTPAVVAGDLLQVILTESNSAQAVNTGPAGWTRRATYSDPTAGVAIGVWYKVADGSEAGTTPTWTSSSTRVVKAFSQSLSGADATLANQPNASAGQANAATTVQTAPSITPTLPNTLLLGLFYTAVATSVTATSLSGGLLDSKTGGGATAGVASEAYAGTTATGTRTMTFNASAAGDGFLLAVAPASGGDTRTVAPSLALLATTTRTVSPSLSLAATTNALTLGALTAEATINSVGFELAFTGDDNANASATLEYKRHGDASWSTGTVVSRVDDSLGGQRVFIGSVLRCDPATAYDLRVTVTDTDGVVGTNPVVALSAATTRADIDVTVRPSPTHYVSTTGNDTTGDGSLGAPWATLNKAVTVANAAAADMVIQVGPGGFLPPSTILAPPAGIHVTFMAQNPAVDDNRSPINAGSRTVILPAVHLTPTAGTWTPQSITGTPTGTVYTDIWKTSVTFNAWPGYIHSSAQDATSASADLPLMRATWKAQSTTHTDASSRVWRLDTIQGAADVMHQNDMWQKGGAWAAQGATGTFDLYLCLPDGTDPNTLHWWLGGHPDDLDTLWRVSGDDVRLSGFQWRLAHCYIQGGAARGIFDHNLTETSALYFFTAKAVPSDPPLDWLVERNNMQNAGTWSMDALQPAIPWNAIKTTLTINGEATGWTRELDRAENSAIDGSGGARRPVIRRNTITGFFNGVEAFIGPANLGSYDRFTKSEYDIHDNIIQHTADDPVETDWGGKNWRVWNNQMDHTLTVISVATAMYGPVYFFRNVAYFFGSDGDGGEAVGGDKPSGEGFKWGGSSYAPALIYAAHNTFWTNSTAGSASGTNGATKGQSGTLPVRFEFHNNLMRTTREAFTADSAATWKEDHNFWGTTDATRGIDLGPEYINVAAYRTATGQGTGTNTHGGTDYDLSTNGAAQIDAGLADTATGDLRLAANSPFIALGAVVPNISDQAGVDYSGAAPSIGYTETVAGGGSRTVAPSLNLLATNTRTLAPSLALLATNTRPVSPTLSLATAAGIRTVSPSLRLLATTTRQVAPSLALLASPTRQVAPSLLLPRIPVPPLTATVTQTRTTAGVGQTRSNATVWQERTETPFGGGQFGAGQFG